MLGVHLADGSNVMCDEVVRVIPNKRLVCKGVWQQKAVYTKLFIGSRAAQYYARDLSGVTDLLAAKIPTPELLFQGQTQGDAYVLVFAAIPSAPNAEQTWQNTDAKSHFALANNLVKTLAQHHNAGLLQTDLYLKNFLVDGDTIYTLDGDGIRKYTSLSRQQALKNLSVLLSKYDVLDVEKWLVDLLKTYAKNRVWQQLPNAEWINNMTVAHRRKVASHYADKKVFRQCTDVMVSSSAKVLTAISSDFCSLHLPKTPDEADDLITSQNLLKNGNTCTVSLVQIEAKQVVIKRYNIKSFWHRVSRALRQSRAAVSWANAHRLKLLNIATAQPIALIESYCVGLKGKAYFLSEYIDAPDAAQFFVQTRDKTQRAEAVKNIANLFYRLYLLHISHGDTKATNIKMRGTKPVLIDLDSMRQHASINQTAHARDLRRFMENWQDDNALYNAFVKAFKVVYADDAPLKVAQIEHNK